MKKRCSHITLIIICCCLAFSVFAASCNEQAASSVEDFSTGDIIAHTSKSRQSRFIRAITESPYTHIGLIVYKEGQFLVLEAVEPVRYTELGDWIARGEGGKYTVMRLQPRYAAGIGEVVREAEKNLGKHYDAKFDPSDMKMYCSELIAKAVQKGAGVNLGEWKAFEDIVGDKIKHPESRREIISRWGKIPSEMKVITPGSIMESKELVKVYSNY